MERPCVSVIVPVHNGQAYLIEALESALTQDLRDIEVLVVDDGSTDSSAFIVEQLAASDGRLRLIRQPQGGAAAARNRGIDEAKGEFLCFLDADDRYEEKRYLGLLYAGVVDCDCKVAAGCLVNWQGPERQERSFAGNELLDGYEFVEEGAVEWREWQFDYGFHRFLFHRSLFGEGAHRFPELSFFEDPVFLAGILDEAGRFFASPDAHYLYRVSHKKRRFTTAQVLDLMEGVRRNLEFSAERGLSRLHGYTVAHFDDYIGLIGPHLNRAVDRTALREPLSRLEAAVDNRLLYEVGRTDLPYRSQLSLMLAPAGLRDASRVLYNDLRYVKNRIL